MTKQEYEAKRAELLDTVQAKIGNQAEFDDAKKAVEDFDNKYEEDCRMQASFKAMQGTKVALTNSILPSGIVAPVAAAEDYSLGGKAYREAFMNFVQKGTPIPTEFKNIDEYTSVSESTAVIPSTILQEMIKEMKTYGQLWSRVRMLNVKGGLNVPILTLKPTGKWTTEASPADREKITANTSVSFSYFGYEVRIAISILAAETTLDMFESSFSSLAAEDIAKAMDTAIIKGAGTTEPTGITIDSRVAGGNKIALTETKISTWASWKKEVFTKMKLSYSTGSFIMAKGTFDTYIDGLSDSTGQPIARVTYGIDGTMAYRFGGKEVILVEDDILASFDNASNTDVFMVFVKLSDYAFNSNMQLKTDRYEDKDKNQWVTRTMLIADGKLLDVNGVLIFTKSA